RSTSRGSGSGPLLPAPFRATSIRSRSWRRGRSSSARYGTCSPAPLGGRGTSSTWGTAFSLRRRWRPCRRSWSGCMAAERIAVLLMAYGGPQSLDDVEPYLRDVRGGRPTPPEFVKEIRQRYARIGGRSPIRELTEAQAAGVRHALDERFAVYVGMRHWHPYIRDVVEHIVADGPRRAVGIVLAPHYSAMSVGAYEKQLLEAARGRLETALVRSWSDHPKFLAAVAGRVTQALQRFPSPKSVQRLFTADRLPERSRALVAEPGATVSDGDGASRGPAAGLGVHPERTESLNDDPLLVEARAAIARKAAIERGWVAAGARAGA